VSMAMRRESAGVERVLTYDHEEKEEKGEKGKRIKRLKNGWLYTVQGDTRERTCSQGESAMRDGLQGENLSRGRIVQGLELKEIARRGNDGILSRNEEGARACERKG
jgi:hypothetical protein